jgi:hypothetical protein
MFSVRWVAGVLIASLGCLALPTMAKATDCPGGMQPTVQSLRACVQHAADMGMIDSAGVAQSLLAKLDAAQAALDGGGAHAEGTAVNLLEAFISAVRAQSGKHIDAAHAEHMVMHARMVIDALALTWLSEAATATGASAGLKSKASLARTYFAVPDVAATCATLAAFDSEARAESGKTVDAPSASRLIEYSESIQVSLSCH